MTTFRHDDVSPPDAAWLAGPLRETQLLAPPTDADHLLVLAAHPDDETLGAGGLIAVAADSGADVTVVVATDGEASHPRSPTHSQAALATRRRGEVTRAVHELAPAATVRFLGLPDGRLTEFADALAGQVATLAGGATLVVAPWAGDRHPDHAACACAATEAARRVAARCWQYPIWAWHWGDPAADALPWHETGRLPLGPGAQEAKRRALAAHVSQHSPLSQQSGDEAILEPGMVAHFTRPFETFVVAAGGAAAAPGYFDRLYAQAADPWGLSTRFYETRKRDVLLAALPRASFGRAFEPGCATGLLTEQLARRCRQVLAWDIASSAVESARHRLTGHPGVEVTQGAVPDQWPDGAFDLVVLSEVGYYCRDLQVLAERAWGSLTPDGVLVACHWRHAAPDHPQDADAVHRALDRPDCRIVSHVEEDFRLDVWTTTGRSVAAETGVLA